MTEAGRTRVLFSDLLGLSHGKVVPSDRADDPTHYAMTVMVQGLDLEFVELPGYATESGYPDIEGENWFGFIVPAGTPKEIVAQLHREIVKLGTLPDVTEKLSALGFESVGNTPEEFVAQIKRELPKWAKLVRDANIKAE